MQFSMIANRVKSLPALAKTGIVFGGYIAAGLIAICVVQIYISRTGGRDRQTYAAMYDFGDFLLFLAVFGLVSTIPTGFALFFLRRSRWFWSICSFASITIAATALLELVLTLVMMLKVEMGPVLYGLSGLAFPRFFVSPILAACFGLSAMIAPEKRFRHLLFAAVLIECAASAFGFFHWFAPLYFQRS